ncbi:MAG: lanthionine synthetase LanC family protein [Rhizomicrobium sp.]
MSLSLFRFASFVLALVAATGAARAASLVDKAAHVLLKRAEPVTWIDGDHTGSAWKTVVQPPDYRTGRGAGAAGVGMGFLAAYDMTGNAAWLNAAGAAGDFLVAAQLPQGSGRWPDYYNPDGAASWGFTSLDDGAPGIADFLWRLYERSGNARYASTALAAMDWEISKAEAPQGQSCPPVCVWHWQDPASKQIYTGMGEGVAGIAWAFDAFAARRAKIDPVRSARYEQYAEAAANWLEGQMVHVRLSDGEQGASIPERPGKGIFETGYLSGSAGDAFLFYQLYRSTGRAQYRRDGDLLLAWVRAQAVTDGSCQGLKWPVQTKGQKLFATGIEEGNAGIGWVALQAYKLLIAREPALAVKDLELARAAGNWLLSSCAGEDRDQKLDWPEDEGRPLVDTSLDNGAPGIAIFLYDLYAATGAPSYRDGAADAQRWVESVSLGGHGAPSWCEQIRDGKWNLCDDPSWDWGAAGILDMAARLNGWPLDLPAEAPGFEPRR